MPLPRAFAIARNLVHNLKNNTNWIARGTTIGEPEQPYLAEPNQTGKYGFTFADAHSGRLFRVTVEEIDIQGNPVNRSDGL